MLSPSSCTVGLNDFVITVYPWKREGNKNSCIGTVQRWDKSNNFFWIETSNNLNSQVLEDNIKMDLKDNSCVGAAWFQRVHSRVWCQVLMNRVRNMAVYNKQELLELSNYQVPKNNVTAWVWLSSSFIIKTLPTEVLCGILNANVKLQVISLCSSKS
jgi:hypothetical protein